MIFALCFKFKYISAAIILAALTVFNAIGAEPSCDTPLAADYDGDGKCDPVVYSRSLGSWQVRLSSANYALFSTTFGASAFTSIVGDFDGDGKADPGVYQDVTGLWLLNLSSLDYATAAVMLGGSGWTAVPADFDGDGKTDPAVYENDTGVWLADLSSQGYTPMAFPSSLGGSSYTPAPADFDGDRKADPAIYGNGIWGILQSGQDYALTTLTTDVTGGVPIAADFDGDRKADPTLYQDATGLWSAKLSRLGYDTTADITLGDQGTTPIIGDFDGDGMADPAAYRESTRTLTVRLSALHYGQFSMVMGAPPAKRVLLLYDSSGPFGWLGKLHVQYLQNLISHFNLPYYTKPIESYEAGDMTPYAATFYIGAVYANPLPAAYCQDVMVSTNTLCWIGYNLWQVAWTLDSASNPAFTEKFGFQYDDAFSGFTQVSYQGKLLPCADPMAAVGIISGVDSNKATVLAVAYTNPPSGSTPYITRGSNLWYVAVNPFETMVMGDHSLAFADLMHNILDIPHVANHRAIIRIEDVNAQTPAATLQSIADYLYGRNIPFVVALIPEYRDPLGVEHQGIPTRLALTDNPALVQVLLNITTHGGQIVQHGYTHQYDSTPNPLGATAQDYEFYRVKAVDGTNVMLGPLIEDTPQWAGGRVLTGKSILLNDGLTPIAWLTPHYLASEMDYGLFPVLFPLALDRGVYFTRDDADAPRVDEYIAPMMIHRDVYGQRRAPETIGYVSPSEGIFPSNLIARADANLVVRDGWAGCYYHWFFGTNYLPELITGLTNLGYQFTTIDPAME